MRRFLFAIFLVVACVTGAAAGSFEDGLSAYERGDYLQAMNLWYPLAAEGDAAAQFNLGLMYRHGQGVPQDFREALKWYRKAAEQGHVWAQFNLGVMYRHGQGTPQNAQEAVKWYRKAAEQGDMPAQLNLDALYDKGRGVPQDFVRAHMWYSIGAKASSGDERKFSLENRNNVASQMTTAQIGKAHEMARRCQDTKFKECD